MLARTDRPSVAWPPSQVWLSAALFLTREPGMLAKHTRHLETSSDRLHDQRSSVQALVMGLPAENHRRATYADLLAVPSNMIAEIINGELRTMPRPAPRHAKASSVLGMRLGPPFQLGEGGPGGWQIIDEPELHLNEDVLVPDLEGWRVERMLDLPETAYFPIAPDWVCEVLSPSTAAEDRAEKMPIYARESVHHVWLIDPIARTLEVFALDMSRRRWLLEGVHRDAACVRAAPFDAVELNLALLWAK